MDKAPVYVKIDKYKEISALIEEIRSKLNDTKVALNQLETLKQEEDTELAAWQNEISNAEMRIENLEKVLAQQ